MPSIDYTNLYASQNTLSRDTDYTELLTQKINTLKNQTQTGGGKEESFYDVVMRYQTGGTKSMYETKNDYKSVTEELQNLSNFETIKKKGMKQDEYTSVIKSLMVKSEKNAFISENGTKEELIKLYPIKLNKIDTSINYKQFDLILQSLQSELNIAYTDKSYASNNITNIQSKLKTIQSELHKNKD